MKRLFFISGYHFSIFLLLIFQTKVFRISQKSTTKIRLINFVSGVKRSKISQTLFERSKVRKVQNVGKVRTFSHFHINIVECLSTLVRTKTQRSIKTLAPQLIFLKFH